MQELLPPPSDAAVQTDEPEPVILSTDLPVELEFDPVPRNKPGCDKFTAEKQRMFIGALAACGSVKTSAQAVRISMGQVYYLRHARGAESFGKAWDKAVECGARRVLDVLVDQAINGTPEKIYRDGQLVAERRRYNIRAMMWVVAHAMPERFGVPGGLMHRSGSPHALKRLKEAWKEELRTEWEAEQQQSATESPEQKEAGARVAEKLAEMRKSFMHQNATDPERRAAWELINGETDWTQWE